MSRWVPVGCCAAPERLCASMLCVGRCGSRCAWGHGAVAAVQNRVCEELA